MPKEEILKPVEPFVIAELRRGCLLERFERLCQAHLARQARKGIADIVGLTVLALRVQMLGPECRAIRIHSGSWAGCSSRLPPHNIFSTFAMTWSES